METKPIAPKPPDALPINPTYYKQAVSNIGYEIAERTLWELGFINIKRWVDYKSGYCVINALEVYSSPNLIDENIRLIKRYFPTLNITGNKNQSFILIKQ